MDFVTVQDDQTFFHGNEQLSRGSLQYRSFLLSAWISRHVYPTSRFRRMLCASSDRRFKRSSSFRYSVSVESGFENYRMMLELAPSIQANFPPIPRRFTPYAYSSLPSSNHFRVFELSPGDWDSPLCGTMVKHSLDDVLEYEAVSYTWGGLPPETTIDCGYGSIAVTTNVASMFRRLRFADRPRSLWIDSLCIDQENNLAEKSAQVQNMASIYGKANRLIIWLGEEDRSTEFAIDMLRTLETVVDDAWNLSGGTWPSLEALQACGLPDRWDRRWLCLQTLFHNRWFTRTWVLQEVALGINPCIQRGSFAFDWNKIVRIILCLCRAAVHRYYNMTFQNVYLIAYFCSTRSWWHQPSLISLLQATIHCSSTLNVDRVFALIGLSAERYELQHLVRYSQDHARDTEDAKKLYKEVAIRFLLKGDLKVLHLASDSSLREFNDMPTWVPDWSLWSRAQPLISYSSAGSITLQTSTSPKSSEKRAPSLPKLLNDKITLVMKGTFVTQVHRIGRRLPVTKRRTDRFIALHIVQQWRRIAGNKLIYLTGESMDEVFARNITADMPSEVLERYEYADLLRSYLQQYPGRKWAKAINEDGGYHEEFEFGSQVAEVMRLRTFFTGRNGMMGVGPYCVRPGDWVVRFEGDNGPFIVRRVAEGRFSFVGDAYVRDFERSVGGRNDVVDVLLV